MLIVLILIVDGWSSINFVDLQKENSTYSAGRLTTEQLGLMWLISSIGGLLGNNSANFACIKRLLIETVI